MIKRAQDYPYFEQDFLESDEMIVAEIDEQYDEPCCNDFHCPCGNSNNYRG